MQLLCSVWAVSPAGMAQIPPCPLLGLLDQLASKSRAGPPLSTAAQWMVLCPGTEGVGAWHRHAPSSEVRQWGRESCSGRAGGSVVPRMCGCLLSRFGFLRLFPRQDWREDSGRAVDVCCRPQCICSWSGLPEAQRPVRAVLFGVVFLYSKKKASGSSLQAFFQGNEFGFVEPGCTCGFQRLVSAPSGHLVSALCP